MKYKISSIKRKRENMAFYDSNFGRKNITQEIPEFDFIQSNFGVEIDPASRVIEVGCGTASNLLSLRCYKMIGLDISNVNLVLARTRSSKLALVQSDVEHIPFRESTFGIVLVVDLLHHVPTPDLVVKEISRIIEKRGKLFIWDACRDGVKPLFPLATFAQKISGLNSYVIENLGPSLHQTFGWLRQSNFTIIDFVGKGCFIRYIGSILESIFERLEIPFPEIFRKILIMVNSKFERLFSGKFPSKFGIVAVKDMC